MEIKIQLSNLTSQINAMDILAVRKGIQYAKEWTTSGKGPMILEMVTYRK